MTFPALIGLAALPVAASDGGTAGGPNGHAVPAPSGPLFPTDGAGLLVGPVPAPAPRRATGRATAHGGSPW